MISRPFTYDPDRKRQIDTLKIFNDNVQEIKENEEYSIPFTSDNRNFSITIILGSNFPTDKPKLILSPPIQHPWCNSVTGEIESAPGFLNYSSHSEIGRIVHAIIRQFEKCPPPLANQATNSQENDSASADTSLTPIVKTTEPTIPELSKLSLDDLKKLDTDPEFFDDFIEEMSVVQALNEELDSMINQVEVISRENQSKESHLKDLKEKLCNDVCTLKDLGKKCEKLNQKYQKKSEEFAPQHINELMEIAASNADTDCEHHVEQFLSGKMDVQTFLHRYTDSKKISAMRKAKEERLTHQLNALERAAL